MAEHTLRDTALDILLRIERDSGYSHLLINQYIQSRQLSLKDVALVTEIDYRTIQRQITLDYYLKAFIRKRKKLDQWVNLLLRMSVYQMVYLDRVPSYAIIDEAVQIAKHRGHKGIASFVNGVLRNIQRRGLKIITDVAYDIKRLSLETSHPIWLINRWVSHYGFECTKAMCQTNLKKKPLSVRIQPLRITRKKALEQFTDDGIDAKPSLFSKQGIIIERGHLLDHKLFTEGYVTIQDQTSMLASEMLNVSPGMKVLDACSAPGGKTTHIAELMNNKGFIYAHDLHQNKLNLIEEKASKLKLNNIYTKQSDARVLQTFYPNETFERILVDAPCSGLGVIRNKPDIKYNKHIKDIKRLARIQLDILIAVAPLLQKGGQLVYSTCTVDPQENEEVVKRFLNKQKNFQVDPEFFKHLPDHLQSKVGITPYGLQIFPQTYNTDGFFLTRLQRLNKL